MLIFFFNLEIIIGIGVDVEVIINSFVFWFNLLYEDIKFIYDFLVY